MSVIALSQAGPECGNKAHALAILMRAGFPVPDGFVVTDPSPDPRRVAAALDRLRGSAYAVRSSGLAEDSSTASFAGQLQSVLGVSTLDEVLGAIRQCEGSARAGLPVQYREQLGLSDTAQAVPVIVQELVEADRSGVVFTRDPRTGAGELIINASWGLGESVVSGAVTPDEYVGARPVRIGSKQTRVDLGPSGLVRSDVAPADQARACLDQADLDEVATLGRRCEALFGHPQDVEWAARGRRFWVVQSRPITRLGTGLAAPAASAAPALRLVGTAGSPGRAAGPVRVIRNVDDFTRVRRGDVLVCRTTDPAWTPLFRLVAAVVTEHGGVLCHAAIVAREFRIPAVLGVDRAMSCLSDDEPVTVDGDHGTVDASHGTVVPFTEEEGLPR